MTNLVEELGANYINQFFIGSYFMYGEKLCTIRACDEEGLIVNTVRLDKDKVPSRWSGERLPADVLKDFSVMQYPRLGYRNSDVQMEPYGNFVVQFGNKRSVFRGLRNDTITTAVPGIFESILPEGINYSSMTNPATWAIDIFRPRFVPFAEGIKRVRGGEWLGFAVSEDIAVCVASSDDPSKDCDVFFRGHEVGKIDTTGTLSLSNKTLERASIRKKLQ